MAHFIGYLHGSAYVEASRLGSKESGIRARVQGWRVGVKVEGRNAGGAGDLFTVAATGGSDREVPDQTVAVVGLNDEGELFVQLSPSHPVLMALEELLASMGRCSVAPGALERAELRGEMNDAVAKARSAINANRKPNFAKKVGTAVKC